MNENQIAHIMFSLKSMLEELNQDELNQVEDFIVNFCDDCYVDQNNNYPNLFRMTILEDSNNA
jgi:hypothetical protein